MLTITEPSGRVRELEDEDIAALPWHQIATRIRWTEGVQTFRGPFLRDVLTGGGMSRSDLAGRKLLVKALNDYGIVLPAGDAWDYAPILAREMNGKPMRVRDKGPLWLVYPRDQRPELQRAVMDERWVWQLFEITIL
ncbi:molybdopterin-dependent oxidoreductase (plasmid) [Paracoccus sp. TD-10]|uniref:molybdopterin-dependent oxidoreductase n=1 Tax=Paracoccus sp. TD-10 TaxID=3395918 RepID=UPI003AAF74CC